MPYWEKSLPARRFTASLIQALLQALLDSIFLTFCTGQIPNQEALLCMMKVVHNSCAVGDNHFVSVPIDRVVF